MHQLRNSAQLSHQRQPQLPETARLLHYDFADRLLHIASCLSDLSCLSSFIVVSVGEWTDYD